MQPLVPKKGKKNKVFLLLLISGIHYKNRKLNKQHASGLWG
jgi:hypothetical protein